MKKLVIAGVLILTTGSVFAENEIFSTLDVDKDGLVSIEEAKVNATLRDTFAQLDVNQDGYLTESELFVKID